MQCIDGGSWDATQSQKIKEVNDNISNVLDSLTEFMAKGSMYVCERKWINHKYISCSECVFQLIISDMVSHVFRVPNVIWIMWTVNT